VNALKKLYLIVLTMFNLLITILIVMIVGYMAYAESKYLFGKPTGCKSVQMKDEIPKTIASAKSALSKAVTNVKKETQKIKMMLQQKKAANNAPKALDISNPIEHIQASNTLVMGSNAIEDTIDENLPFAKYEGNFKVQKAVNGLIEGVRPPTYADPRTMNPSLAAAPVQFSDPAMFGTFGVTDQTSLAFTTKDARTDAAIASDRTLEGFSTMDEKTIAAIESDSMMEEFDIATDVYDANGAVLIMDGKIVKSASELPSAQIMGAKPHTTLPMRNLHNPPPIIEDLVEGEMFDGLQGYPVNENLDFPETTFLKISLDSESSIY
jgi:hypothetical protein